ncbi:MAG: D-2-hydroxyacid dehydrogenase [Planctomycetes bacterium]|nr:D-2-hydroxyacid dehydrogenase [Planctomycetota bacterium]
MRTTILDSYTADQGRDAWQTLRQSCALTVHLRSQRSQVVDRCRDAEAVITNKVAIDAQALAALPSVRYIGVMATGTNVVDLDACRNRGIVVSNVPGYATESVAQLVFAQVLQVTHDVAGHSHDAKSGRWSGSEDFCFFRQPLVELAGKTLVVIGSGAIGSSVARIARAFGMRTIAAQVPGSTNTGRMPLPEALREADVVSLHCPLTPRTERLVDEAFLRALKQGAILVNTGRGPLLDEAAVVAALASGLLGGLCVDVLSSEPPPAGHPFMDRGQPWSGRVVVTPHIAWGTIEARARLIDEVTANLVAFAAGRERNRVA